MGLGPPRGVLLVAPPASRRVRAFQETLRVHGWPPARVVPYLDLLRGNARLQDLVRPGDVVRLESPGEDIGTERALLDHGGGLGSEGAALDLTGGEVLPTRTWYRGFHRLLTALDDDLRLAPPHGRMQAVPEVLAMFDKRVTHGRLQRAGVPVPEALEEVRSAEDLLDALRARGWRRAFVKLAHGSSASGALALEIGGERVQATTTVEAVPTPGGLRLFNSRRLRRVRGWGEVRALIDALAPQGLHVERWVPKAGWAGRPFDLRVVVIAGRARHVLVRLGRGSMTNLHLGGDRGDWDAVRARLGEDRWRAVRGSCEAALARFPGALYAGVDVLITPGWQRHAVLEVNAFGDYHRGVLSEGLDTYGAELRALQAAHA